MRRLDLNACRYDVYSCTHNDSESQNGSAGLRIERRDVDVAHMHCRAKHQEISNNRLRAVTNTYLPLEINLGPSPAT
eukprot:scaffold1643_cov123-Skeletonema_marinoi.AAC.4